MLPEEVKGLLLHIAEELKKIEIGDDFWQDRPVKNASNMNTRTMIELWRQYLEWEKDPVYREIFGEMLRVRILLASIDGEFRQRQGWEHWFMALYRKNNRWTERAELFDHIEGNDFAKTIYRPDNWMNPYQNMTNVERMNEKIIEKQDELRKKQEEEAKDDGT